MSPGEHTARLATQAEREMWVLAHGAGPGLGLVAFAHLRLRGFSDSGRLLDAVARLVTERREFTSRFELRPDGLVVEQGGSGTATVTTFSATTQIRDVQEALGSKQFDLAEGPVCHAGVRIDEADGTADVVIAAHHALFDGASDEVVLHALIACYESGSPNDPAAAEAATASRGDGGSVAARAGDLADVPDLPALEQLSFRDLLHRPGAWTSGDLATITHEDVVACARTRRVTPYAVYLAAFGAAVGRVTGSRRFAIGIALARRTEAERNMIGCFVRLVPVRIDLDAPSLLPAVWDDLGRAMASPSIGFSDWGGTRRSPDPSRMPLFQACFSYQGWKRETVVASGVTFTTRHIRELGCHAEYFGEVVLEGQDLQAGFSTPEGDAWHAQRGELAVGYAESLAALIGGRL